MDQIGWVIFLVALLFSVMLHESGHFVAAKRFGMKATKYFIGFGPTLWSTTRGETEYGIKALPVGGYVKIIGMTSLDEVDPEDEPRSFRQAPAWQRLIVLAAGSFMHFVLAAVIIFGLALGIGIENDNTTQLGTVAACVPASEAALNSGAACAPADAKSPALLAGIKVGDQVTSFNGVPVNSWTQLENVIKDAKPGSVADDHRRARRAAADAAHQAGRRQRPGRRLPGDRPDHRVPADQPARRHPVHRDRLRPGDHGLGAARSPSCRRRSRRCSPRTARRPPRAT